MKSLAKNTSSLDYLLVTLLVCLSGNQAFTASWRLQASLVLTAAFLGGLLLVKKALFISHRFHIVAYVYCAILLIQCITFNFYPKATLIGFLIRIFIAYAVLMVVNNFSTIYINVLYYTGIISLGFYIPEQAFNAIGLSFRSFFEPIRKIVNVPGDFHILIYNFDVPYEIHRNSGFFWEPGAFAGYLLVALIFLGLKKHAFSPEFYRRRLTVLVGTTLTTFSTAGYLVLGVVLLIHAGIRVKSRVALLRTVLVLMVAVPILSFAAYRTYNSGFIKEKIIEQHERVVTQAHNWERTRLGSLLFDWEYIKRRPLLGWGLHPQTRYMLHFGQGVSGMGNGLSAALGNIGIVGVGTFLLFTWTGLSQLSGGNRKRTLLAFLAILLMLNGQAFLNYPLFWGLMFMGKEPDMRQPDHADQALEDSASAELAHKSAWIWRVHPR